MGRVKDNRAYSGQIERLELDAGLNVQNPCPNRECKRPSIGNRRTSPRLTCLRKMKRS